MAVECVIKNAAKSVGEGPHWDDVTNTLLYVDIQENAIRKYCPESKEHSTIQLGMQFYCFIIIWFTIFLLNASVSRAFRVS